MEKVERRSIEQEVKGAEASKKIAELRAGTFDKGVENRDKLIENTKQIIEIQKADFSNQAAIATKKYEITRNQMALENKMSADKIEALTFEYTKNQEILELGEKYNAAQKKIGTGGKAEYFKRTRPGKYNEVQTEIALINSELQNSFQMTGEDAGKLAANFEKPTLKALKGLADLKKVQTELEGQAQIGSRRDENLLATAINKKEAEATAAAKKAQEDANTLSKKQIDYDSEIGRQRISNQIEIEQTLLNAKKDSAEKQRQQAELDFRKTLVDIANQKENQLKKMNEANGGIDLKTGKKTDKYIATLPEADQAQIDGKVIAAEELKNSTIDKINEKEAEKIKQMWQEVTDYRLKGIEKEKEAVKKYYDDMEKLAKKAGDTALLAAIVPLRKKANDDIDRKYALEELDFQEKIETQKNEIHAKGLNRQSALEKANFETWVKYQKQKLELLKQSSDPKDKKAAQLLDNEITIKTKEQQRKFIQEQLNSIAEISGYVDQITEKYAEQLGLTKDQAQVLKSVSGYAKGVAEIASGNVVGGAFSLISSTLDLFVKAPVKISEQFEHVYEQINKVIKSLEIAEKSLSNIGQDSSLLSLRIVKSELLSLADDAKSLNDELAKSSTGRRRATDMNLPAQDLVKQAVDLNAEIDKLSNRLLQGDISDDQRKAIEAVLDSYNELLAKIDATVQDITGTTVSDLSRGLADAFLSGEDAAESWGQKVDDIIKNVISRQLTAQLLTKPVTDAVNILVNDSGDGLTTDEAAKFKKSMDDLYASTAPAFAAVQQALQTAGFNIGNNSSSAATGISRSVTEDTMSAFIGMITAVRIDIKSILVNMAAGQDDVSKTLLYMKEIAENTKPIYRLKAIEEGITKMNQTLTDKL